MPKFFIERPVCAWVISLMLIFSGILAINVLPISQYPNIAPPQIFINAFYPGASAQTVQDTIAQVIEQRMNGLDGLDYISSESTSTGSMRVKLTFRQGTNPDIAQVNVQNKMQLAMPSLPAEVQRYGVTVKKSTDSFLAVLAFISTDNSMNKFEISDFISSNIQDQINRIHGVGDTRLFGTPFAMRIWLDPAKLNNFGLITSDIIGAIQAQNIQVASGQLGGLPAVPGQQLTASIIGSSSLKSPEEFDNILLKVNPNGSQVRLRDVGYSELGGEYYGVEGRFNNMPTGGLAIQMESGANALKTIEEVDKTISRLKPFFPHGLQVNRGYDTTPFIRLSINEVIKTLIESIILVFFVMYLFLQNFRSTLIPTITIPIVLLGTFVVLLFFDYSINVLTMFAMVLAVGILIDDSIVVIENVERVMKEEGLSPKEATKKSMNQITGALINIVSVLIAVFLPMTFFGGSIGVIYRQFSVTIISAMVLSIIVTLSLTPVLCASILKPFNKEQSLKKKGFFSWFNRIFDKSSRYYITAVGNMLIRPIRFFLIFACLIAISIFMFTRVPTAFLPEEDQGVMLVQVQTPPGSTHIRTEAVLDKIRDYFTNKEKDTVEAVFTVNGFNFSGHGQSCAMAFIKLKDWKLRSSPNQKVQALAARVMRNFAPIKDAFVFGFVPPAIIELGLANGFNLHLQDRSGVGYEKLKEGRNQFLRLASQSPLLTQVRPGGQEDAPQYQLIIDREKASALGVQIPNINNAMSTIWGSTYINNFVDKGRVKKVFMQGIPSSRMNPEDLNKWHVRNSSNKMVPFSSFTSAKWGIGPQMLNRYNGVQSMEIQGKPAPGQSTGTAMKVVESLLTKLPPGIGFEWTGISFEEHLSGSRAPILYAISLIVVFLSLAVLYESWIIPSAVMMVVPLGIFGTIMATWLRGLSNDIYFQVGMLVTVGLSIKNAILIIEFAKNYFDNGTNLISAVLRAAKQRLRPILMTSIAFIFGVLPLALASGVGSGTQNAIGTGVIGGMLSATFLAIFMIPLFFIVILRLFHVKPKLNTNVSSKQ
ncbi:MAG: efflux RND transporter permease subunit [Rhodospirillaceae bacterium]|nr:efflux RND transporter permease subunit [Rhodospirillaceae bacterium]